MVDSGYSLPLVGKDGTTLVCSFGCLYVWYRMWYLACEHKCFGTGRGTYSRLLYLDVFKIFLETSFEVTILRRFPDFSGRKSDEKTNFKATK